MRASPGKQASPAAPRFDLAGEALYKASLVFTPTEEDALEASGSSSRASSTLR